MNENHSRDHESRPDTSSANRQAAEWLVLLESGDATDQDYARFEAWLAEEPGHREAYAALGETWGRLTVMGRRARADGGVGQRPDVAVGPLEPPARAPRRRHGQAWAAAAAVVVVAVLAGLLFVPEDPATPYRTDVGERRTVSLADGSSLELNTDTELVVEYTDEQRRISMIRGEAFFDIAVDTARPFVVTAGQRAIRAVGTEFAVRLKSAERISVTVTDGLVEVTYPVGDHSVAAQPGDAVEPPLLQPGQRAEYDREAIRIEEITRAELDRAQAWRRGLLVFEDASLAEVVAEVNRYTETPLVLADPGIGQLRLGGTFKTGRVEALLEVLEQGFGVRASRGHRNMIELRAPSADAAR